MRLRRRRRWYRPFASVLFGLVVSATVANLLARDVRAQGGTCVDTAVVNLFSGEVRDVTQLANGVSANVYTAGSAYFYACSLSSPGNDAASAWVSIEPGSGNPTHSSDTILQIGIVRCTSGLYSACNAGVVHYFWAYGGCLLSKPYPRDLGSTVHGTHPYEISLNGSTYELKIAGVIRATIPKDNSGIGCWTNGDTRATWFAERLDHGDSVGSNGSTSQRLQFNNMYYRTGSTWIAPALTSCINDVPTGIGRYVCTNGSSTNWFDVWTIY
jgi:hypothetical protein